MKHYLVSCEDSEEAIDRVLEMDDYGFEIVEVPDDFYNLHFSDKNDSLETITLPKMKNLFDLGYGIEIVIDDSEHETYAKVLDTGWTVVLCNGLKFSVCGIDTDKEYSDVYEIEISGKDFLSENLSLNTDEETDLTQNFIFSEGLIGKGVPYDFKIIRVISPLTK